MGNNKEWMEFEVEALEPRLLLSADPVLLAAAAAPQNDTAQPAIEVSVQQPSEEISDVLAQPVDMFEGLDPETPALEGEPDAEQPDVAPNAVEETEEPVPELSEEDQAAVKDLPDAYVAYAPMSKTAGPDEMFLVVENDSKTIADELVETQNAANPPPVGVEMIDSLDAFIVAPLEETSVLEATLETSGLTRACDLPLSSLTDMGVDHVVINGADDIDDTFLIDFTFDLLPSTVTYHGGDAGYDTLVLKGVSGGAYTPDSLTFGSGIIETENVTIYFTGLEPVVVDGIADEITSFTFRTPGSADVISIGWDAVEGGNIISGTSDTVAFESVTFLNIEEIIVDAGANDISGSDADTVTIDSTMDSPGLKNLTILTGAGDDTLTIVAPDLDLPVAGGEFLWDGGRGGPIVLMGRLWTVTGWLYRTIRAL